MRLIVGIFVGGASRRMGRPKGLLAAPGRTSQTLVERLSTECRGALGDVPLVLVGERAEYAGLGLPALADARPNSGPLSGLIALLEHARACGADAALALACDLPYVEGRLIARLARDEPDAAVLAPRVDDRWQPLVARYGTSVLSAAVRALTANQLSLQHLLRDARAQELVLNEEEAQSLRDWDRPEDVAR